MDNTKIRGHQVICSAFIEKDNKFLVIMCPNFNVWRVPGGRAEWRERIEETLIRELQEEVGITFKEPKFVGFGQDSQFQVKDQIETSRLIMFFHVKIEEDPKFDPKEVEDFKWVTLDELKNIKDKEGALKDLFERNKNFSL